MQTTAFATLLGWTEKQIPGRLRALGLLETCSRCGGGGNYSRCQRWGTTCFKCSGSGKQVPTLTAKLAKLVAGKVEAGELAPYLAHCARIAEARKMIAPLMIEARAAYEPISERYMTERVGRDAATIVASEIFELQTKNNALYWGVRGNGHIAHPMRLGAIDIERACKLGELDALSAVAHLVAIVAQIKALSPAAECSESAA